MADDERLFLIPVAFQVAGADRERAATVLHSLLQIWDEIAARTPVVDDQGTVTHPVRSRWFPEPELKHIDGNTREPRTLYIPSPFLDAYEDTPVLELLAEAFPTPPHPDAYRTPQGEVDEDAYGAAFDTFTDRALDLAVNLTHLNELTQRLERAEQFRDGVIDLLERVPLPEEPQQEDYLVTVAPHFEGEIEDARYRWDHTRWEADFRAVAEARERQVRELLHGAGARSPYLPPRFQNEWLPADLAAVQALRDLVAQEHSAAPVQRQLSRETRAELRALLHLHDMPVQVNGADGASLYTGAASGASAVLPAGVYDATTGTAAEPVRLVVGPAGRTGTLASAAFRVGEHEQSVLDEIARTMQAVADEALRDRLGEILATTGRSGHRIVQPRSTLEEGVLLSELLRHRSEHLADPADPPQDPPEGLHRPAPGLDRP